MRVASLIVPVIAIALLVAAAGCGSDSESGADTDGGEASTELEITFWPQGRSKGNAETWTLTCDPAGGTLPNPAEACAKLGALDDPFAPPPEGQICTEIYGGPEEGLVTGTYRGEPVSARLARTNGCEISRFEELGFLMPRSGPA